MKLELGTNPSGATLFGGGGATSGTELSGLWIDKPGEGYTLHATGRFNGHDAAPTTSTPFTVGPRPPGPLRILDLGLGYAAAVNASGQVAINVGDVEHPAKAVLWDHDSVTVIANLCVAAGVCEEEGAWAINGVGDVALTVNNNAFLWHRGTLTDLGSAGGGGATIARWINDADDVLGGNVATSSPAFPLVYNAVLWRGGQQIRLTLGGDYAAPAGLNAAGQVAGTSEFTHSSTPGSGLRHAFLWQNGTIKDLGTLGGNNSGASDINALGQVAGWAETPDSVRHAVIWSGDTTIDLGPGTATAINAGGQVAGTSDGRAVLWDRGSMIIVNDSGYVTGLNDAGQVIGQRAGPFDAYYWSNHGWGGNGFLWDRGYLTEPPGLCAKQKFPLTDPGPVIDVLSISSNGWIAGSVRYFRKVCK